VPRNWISAEGGGGLSRISPVSTFNVIVWGGVLHGVLNKGAIYVNEKLEMRSKNRQKPILKT
jgi:hypothetical protein